MIDEEENTEGCALCGRVRRLTFHHLIPVTLHRNRWFKKRYTRAEMQRGVMLCRDCHNAVHRFINHKDLGREWNTLERLQVHPELSRFVAWVSRQQRMRSPISRPNDR